MKKAYLTGPVLLIVAAIVFFVALTLFLNSKLAKRVPNQPTSSPSLVIQNQASPNLDETANWETYSNSHYRFSFKYPESWKTKEEDDSVYFGDTQIVDSKNRKISLSILNRSIEQAKGLLNYGDAGLLNRAESITTEKLGGVEITKAIVVFSQLDHELNLYVEENRSYQILIPLSDSATLRFYANVKDKNFLDQMLSTFKFLN